MAEKKEKKKPNISLLLGIAIAVFYISQHFTSIECDRGGPVPAFCTTDLNSVFKGDTEGYLLWFTTIETDLGTIKIRPFCSFIANSHKLSHICVWDFADGTAEHDIVVLGNKFRQDEISISFDGRWGNNFDISFL